MTAGCPVIHTVHLEGTPLSCTPQTSGAITGSQSGLKKVFGAFGSFAVAFSYISVTTGIFTTFEPLIASSGPGGIWLWPVVVIGQTLVALVYGELAAKIPIAGYSYTWARYLGSPRSGWWLGWLSLASVAIVTVAVDWIFVEQGLGSMFVIRTSLIPGFTAGVIAIQMLTIMGSSRLTALINDTAVWTESVGMLALCIILFAVAMNRPSFNMASIEIAFRQPLPSGWGLILALLPGAYTLTGFESASNMIEETRNARRIVPKTMWLSVVCSGVLGMTLMLVFVSVLPANKRPNQLVWDLIYGGSFAFLTNCFVKPVVCISMFACGLVMLVTNSRLLYAMARDRCLPGADFLSWIPQRWATPVPAIGAVAIGSGFVTLILYSLKLSMGIDIIGSVTLGAILMATILYILTLVLYVRKGRHFPTKPGYFQLKAWRWPIVCGASLWLICEAGVFVYAISQWPRRALLSGPARSFCEIAVIAQLYAVGVVLVGVLLYLVVRRLEPGALAFRPQIVQTRSEPLN